MPDIGTIIFVRSTDHFGDAPDWVAAIVTDVHATCGGSMMHKEKDVFSCTVFYPQLTHTRPYDFYFGKDEGETWSYEWLPGPGEVLEAGEAGAE